MIGSIVWFCGMLAILGSIFVPVAVPAGTTLRPAAVAGSWYPGDARELGDYIDGLLANAHPPAPESTAPIRALILPHAGYRFSGATAATAVRLVQGHPYKRVIVIGPAHRGGFRGLSVADVSAYETPLGRIPVDTEAVKRLRQSPLVVAAAEAHAREHSIEMELPLLQRALPAGWQLLPVLVGRMQDGDYRQAAALLRPLLDADTLLVVSSDFTHYGRSYHYLPFPVDERTPARIRTLDRGALQRILARDPDRFLAYRQRTGDTICGFGPIAVLLEVLPDDAVGQALMYTTSGELSGDYSQSVSYYAVAFRAPKPLADGDPKPGLAIPDPTPTASAGSAALGAADLRLLHRIACAGVTAAVADPEAGRERLEALLMDLPPELKRAGGAFVTLQERGHLRGCIGYILPHEPLYRAVYENGINAAHNDLRFPPVKPAELEGLELEVSVLSVPRPIASYQEFEVGRQGIVLKKDGRRAVFLPEVAREQGWDREQTLSHLATKAGLPADAWRQGARFEVFTSQKYSAPYRAEE